MLQNNLKILKTWFLVTDNVDHVELFRTCFQHPHYNIPLPLNNQTILYWSDICNKCFLYICSSHENPDNRMIIYVFTFTSHYVQLSHLYLMMILKIELEQYRYNDVITLWKSVTYGFLKEFILMFHNSFRDSNAVGRSEIVLLAWNMFKNMFLD